MVRSTRKQMTYGLEASPPFYVLIVLAVQHVLVIIVDLSLPVLVVTAMGGSPAQTTWMVQMSMVAIAVGMLLQIQQKRHWGRLLDPTFDNFDLHGTLLVGRSERWAGNGSRHDPHFGWISNGYGRTSPARCWRHFGTD